MTDEPTNLKGGNSQNLNFPFYSFLCISSAVQPTLAETVGLQQVQGAFTPLPEQGFLCCKIYFLFGLQEET